MRSEADRCEQGRFILRYPSFGGLKIFSMFHDCIGIRLGGPRSAMRCRRAIQPRHYPRESRDTPNAKAFCRVAPTVRFIDFAILLAGVFFFASPFRLRTSAAVHSRFFVFFAMRPLSSDESNNCKSITRTLGICQSDHYGIDYLKPDYSPRLQMGQMPQPLAGREVASEGAPGQGARAERLRQRASDPPA